MKKKTRENVEGALGLGIGAIILGLGVAASVIGEESARNPRSNNLKSLDDIAPSARVKLSDETLVELAKALKIHDRTFEGVRRQQLILASLARYSGDFKMSSAIPNILLSDIAKQSGLNHRVLCDELSEKGVEHAYWLGSPARSVSLWSSDEVKIFIDVVKDYIC